MADNVLRFPGSNVSPEEGDMTNLSDEYLEFENRLSMFNAEELAMDLFVDSMFKLVQVGNVDFEEFPQDVGLILETLRAVQYRQLGIPHELHDVADTLYDSYTYSFDEDEDLE